MTSKHWNPETALARMGNDRSILSHLILIFHEDAGSLFEKLKAQTGSSDFEEACRTSHSLKGLAMNFDAHSLSSAAEKIEVMCRGNDTSQMPEKLNALEADLNLLSEELSDWLRTST